MDIDISNILIDILRTLTHSCIGGITNYIMAVKVISKMPNNKPNNLMGHFFLCHNFGNNSKQHIYNNIPNVIAKRTPKNKLFKLFSPNKKSKNPPKKVDKAIPPMIIQVFFLF